MEGVLQAHPDIYIIYNIWQKNIPHPQPHLYSTYIIYVFIIERYYMVYNMLVVDVRVCLFGWHPRHSTYK